MTTSNKVKLLVPDFRYHSTLVDMSTCLCLILKKNEVKIQAT